MSLEHLIQCCLATDPDIVPGSYTVILSNSKSGALNSGVLMFTDSEIDKRQTVKIEYRLVSILMMLMDLKEHLLTHSDQTSFQIHLPETFKTNVKEQSTHLTQALESRGIHHELAAEIVFGGRNTS